MLRPLVNIADLSSANVKNLVWRWHMIRSYVLVISPRLMKFLDNDLTKRRETV